MNNVNSRHKVVIVGGGFGGLGAAQALKSANVDVTVIDERNFHLFQPLLYQVATGSLSPGEIAAPLRGVLSGQKNARVLLGRVEDIDPVSESMLFSPMARSLSMTRSSSPPVPILPTMAMMNGGNVPPVSKRLKKRRASATRF